MSERDPGAPDEDAARTEKTVADLIEEDRADPATPDHFDVDTEPLDLEDDDAG